MSDLFPADFVAALSNLRVEARRVPPRGWHAEHHAREAGSGIEFRDYRSYAPGDDFRRVDWNLYRRFDRLFLRLLDEVRDLPLYTLLDLSDSMWLESAPRADAARRAAAVMGAVSLNQLDVAAVYPFGKHLGDALRPVHGKRSLHRLLGFLEGRGALGETDFKSSLQAFAGLPVRRGLVAVISDFFDEHGLAAIEAGLSVLRHRLVLIRIVRKTDRNPDLSGELRLADCETDQTLDVSVSENVLARYREAYRAFDEGLKDMAARRGASLLDVDADEDILSQFSPLFPDGVFKA